MELFALIAEGTSEILQALHAGPCRDVFRLMFPRVVLATCKSYVQVQAHQNIVESALVCMVAMPPSL